MLKVVCVQGLSCLVEHSSEWKTLMKIFVIDQDMELWDIIAKELIVPMKKVSEGNDV